VAATGSVIWFSHDRGYGFIAPDDGRPDLFVHFSGVAGDHKQLGAGTRVLFETRRGSKGMEAANVSVAD
jgi:CspA family cold shock protein